MTRFSSLIFLFALLVALVSATPSRGSSSSGSSVGERALFGYSYSEDCLFGTSSHLLYGAPKPKPAVPPTTTTTTTIPVKKVDTRPTEESAAGSTDDKRTVAFVRRSHYYPQATFGQWSC
ncbi:expressed unknown protein [Seminavis robusta]|uniref:Secreted protein n=1 Tax=Seminavis robusta TaxID=568900 RepID=A0A9N8DT21_9STRA|nr:expressed unknown protein [Seminavis robusta]|eukprot:Sro257_g100980.1 n/a (120) ;mRNA; f:77494-77853